MRVNSHRVIPFSSGAISPIATSQQIETFLDCCFQSSAGNEHWFFPPKSTNFSVHMLGGGSGIWRKEKPETARPAHLFFPPITHQLRLGVDAPVIGEPKQRYFARLIIQSFAFFHWSRGQFEDWRFDTRIPISTAHPWLTPGQLSEALNQITDHARGLREKHVRALVGILHLRNRISSYEWSWERFNWLYTAIDACFRQLSEVGVLPPGHAQGGHSRRLFFMCDQLDIETSHEPDREVLQRAVRVRNALVHEFSWGGAQPGTEHFIEGNYLVPQIRGFLDRLLMFCMGVDCDFRTRGGWSEMAGRFPIEIFGQPPEPPPFHWLNTEADLVSHD